MNSLTKRAAIAAALCSVVAFGVSAQTILTTVQQFAIAPQPDGWSFDFQLSRFLPSSATDTLVKVEIILSETSSFPSFTVTTSQDNSVANCDVSEAVTVKNLKFNADDGCDDDNDNLDYKEAVASTEFSGNSSALMTGATQSINGVTLTTNVPTITLTNPDDLQRFIGDPNSPKSLNFKIVNKQSRSFTWKPGDGTFNPARKDYHPTTSATLTLNYYTSTTSTSATVESAYSTNSSYLIIPASATYSSNTTP